MKACLYDTPIGCYASIDVKERRYLEFEDRR